MKIHNIPGTNITLKYKINKNKITIVDCNIEASGTLVIPNSINGITVSKISHLAFRGCNKLTKVRIPNSVIAIGDNAFYNCDELTTVIISKNLIFVGDAVFLGCDNLNNIKTDDGIPYNQK